MSLALWPCGQQTPKQQRDGRYLDDSYRHPGKMLPELARRAIEAYSNPGDLVVDPMCGIGTTLVEAIHLGRDALGVELEPRWAALATANLSLAREQGASGRGGGVEGDARDLAHLLARTRGKGRCGLGRHPAGSVDLILTSPPYGCEVGEPDKQAWNQGGNLCAPTSRNYSRDSGNLGHARGHEYLDAMRDLYRACATVLKPGGFLVTVTKNMRSGGRYHDLAATHAQLCTDAGLLYWQHVIALHAAIRDSRLVPRPSFWQRLQLQKARERGERVALVVHEDVLVFRKPEPAAATTQAQAWRVA